MNDARRQTMPLIHVSILKRGIKTACTRVQGCCVSVCMHMCMREREGERARDEEDEDWSWVGMTESVWRAVNVCHSYQSDHSDPKAVCFRDQKKYASFAVQWSSGSYQECFCHGDKGLSGGPMRVCSCRRRNLFEHATNLFGCCRPPLFSLQHFQFLF